MGFPVKKALLGAIALGIIVIPAHAATEMTNLGVERDNTFTGHVIGDDGLGGGPAVLYAPSEADDAGYRAGIAAAVGGTCDYYDARAGVPTLDFLLTYTCVHTWANFAYFDNVAYGNVLADFVDAGGNVVLGAFSAYTSGSFLSGRVMQSGYCPVTGGTNHFSDSPYRGDGTTCMHDGISAYSATYRDILTLQGDGAQDGSFADGEIAGAYNPAFSVLYANGSGGAPVTGTGQITDWVGNSCRCSGGSTPIEEISWGTLKSTY
jgi:hypothetical protein